MRERLLLESALVRTRPARMRVEELAGKAGVSVDTVRFYQKQRLLPRPSGKAASPGTPASTWPAWPG